MWPFGEVRWERKAQMKVTFQISGLNRRCCPRTSETTGWSAVWEANGFSTGFMELAVSSQGTERSYHIEWTMIGRAPRGTKFVFGNVREAVS